LVSHSLRPDACTDVVDVSDHAGLVAKKAGGDAELIRPASVTYVGIEEVL
jgi:hypothetical protein